MMHANRAIALAFSLVCGCASYPEIGGATIVVRHGAQPWPDLPEALLLISTSTSVPSTVLDGLAIYVYPAGWALSSREPVACEYDLLLAQINARVSDEPTSRSCLPHELAHRWRHVEAGQRAATRHDDAWRGREHQLIIITRTTWFVRKGEP